MEKNEDYLWKWNSERSRLISYCEVVEGGLSEICQEVVIAVVENVAHNTHEFR